MEKEAAERELKFKDREAEANNKVIEAKDSEIITLKSVRVPAYTSYNQPGNQGLCTIL